MPRPSTIVAAILLARHAEGLVAPRSLAASHSTVGLATRHRHNIIHAPSLRRGARASLRLGAQGEGDGDRGDIVVEEGGGPPGDDVTSYAPLQPPRQPRDASASGRNVNNNGDEQSIARALSLMGTSPRRIFLSLASSTAIALAANLFGITSNLLTALPDEFSEKTGFDTYYPRGGYKRVVVRGGSSGGGVPGTASTITKCSFLIPQDWVADTGLALAQAKRRAVPLDYSMGSSAPSSSGVLPDAAYGPPGRLDDQGLSNGDTNVSVIVNTDVKDFRLASLGNGPTEAAETLLAKRRRPTKLESASERRQGDDGVPVYQFEYTVDRGENVPPLRAISVVAGSAWGDAFVTLTVVSVEGAWADPVAAARLRKVAESFKLV